MKRAAVLLGIPLLIVAGLYLLLLRSQSASNDLTLNERDVLPPVSTPGSATENSADEPTIGSALAQPQVPSSARPATVFRLADGDSFDIVWVDTGDYDEVRLVGINAPEGGACYGDEARLALELITKDQELQIDMVERDEFGRILAHVWVGDVFVNATLVERGAALALTGDGSYGQLIGQSQVIAKQTFQGLWDPEVCGSNATAALQIGWIEADAPGRDNENRNGEWIAIVNDGETAEDLTGWSIRDESTRHRFFFPDGFMLGPAGEVQVFSGCGNDTADALYWCDEDPVWNNGGDTGFLVDPNGRFADIRSYGS